MITFSKKFKLCISGEYLVDSETQVIVHTLPDIIVPVLKELFDKLKVGEISSNDDFFSYKVNNELDFNVGFILQNGLVGLYPKAEMTNLVLVNYKGEVKKVFKLKNCAGCGEYVSATGQTIIDNRIILDDNLRLQLTAEDIITHANGYHYVLLGRYWQCLTPEGKILSLNIDNQSLVSN